jgi:predicted TIM-barrel fold metal-dependent hydrolase
MSAPLVVDCHAHLWGRGFLPAAFYAEAARGWAARKPNERTPAMIMPKLLEGVVDETGDGFVANMDRAGVDVSLIQMVDGGAPLFGEEPPVPLEEQVERYAEIQARHRGRLYCNIYPDYRRPQCLDLIRRAVKELGFVGVGEVTPDGFRVSDPELRPVMELAAELDVPVQVHTRSGIWTELVGSDFSEANAAHPRHVADLARAIPELRLVLCHAGFPHWWAAAGALIADLPNCYLDISDWNEVVDRPEEIIARLAARDIVGCDRILFGSDQVSGPRFVGERSHLPEWVALIRDLPTAGARYGYRFSVEEAAQILGENARRLYRLGT